MVRNRIGHAGEGALRLRRRRAAPEHSRTPFLGTPPPLLPHRCLTDPRCALEHQRGESFMGRPEERVDLGKLCPAPDNLECRHSPTLNGVAFRW